MIEQGVMSNDSTVGMRTGVQSNSDADAAAPVSYGARLAMQRQSAGLGVTDVAAQLRLHPNQVRAIEQEDLARLPAPAYIRGFVRSYARMLKIDPSPLLSDLNAKLEPARESVLDGGATDYSAAHAASRERKLPQWMFGAALLILIALGVVGWLANQPQQQPLPPTPAALPAAPAAAPAMASTEPAAQIITSEATASPGTASPAAASEATASEAAASTAAADPVPAPTDTAEPTVASSVIASGAAPTLVLRFNGASWAEVTDRGGKILLSQLSSEGAEHALDGELPLTVVIGDANFASVEVRGAAFNLRPFTRNNVARFTIK
jgi:cytoskeleton protein RodZ